MTASLGSLSKRDIKNPDIVAVPATAASLPAEFIDQSLNYPTTPKRVACSFLNFEKEKSKGEKLLLEFNNKPLLDKCLPHNVFEAVIGLVHCGFLREAVSLEQKCLSDLEDYVKTEKRASLSAMQGKRQAAKMALGGKNFRYRCFMSAACLFLIVIWPNHFMRLCNRVVILSLLLIVCGDIINWTSGGYSVLVDNSTHNRDGLQQEIMWISNVMGLAVSVNAADTIMDSFMCLFFVYDVALGFIQLSLALNLIALIFDKYPPEGLSFFVWIISVITLVGYMLRNLYYQRGELLRLQNEMDSMTFLIKNLQCFFDEKTSSYHFSCKEDCRRLHSISSLLTCDSSRNCGSERLFFTKNAIWNWSIIYSELHHAIASLKAKALGRHVSKILDEILSLKAVKGLNFHSDVFLSNRKGINLCYLALLDILEHDVSLKENSRAIFDKICDIEEMEINFLRKILFHNIMPHNRESYDHSLHFTVAKRVIFTSDKQLDIFRDVRDYYVKYCLRCLKFQCEAPMTSLTEGNQRLKYVIKMLDASQVEMMRGDNKHTIKDKYDDELSKIKSAVAHLRNRMKLTSIMEKNAQLKETEVNTAIGGSYDPCLRATPRYYHPSMYCEVCEGGEKKAMWSCCKKSDRESIGCRVDYFQKGCMLKVYHHPLPWSLENKQYECCFETTRNARGCVEGFHPNPWGSQNVPCDAD